MMGKQQLQQSRNMVGIGASLVLGTLLSVYSLILLWPQGNNYDSVKIRIPEGASLKEAGKVLFDQNIINNERSFMLAVKMLGYEKDLPAGRFRLSQARTNYAIINQLVHGLPVQRLITIYEGWSIKKVASELERTLGINAQEFIDLCSNQLLLWRLGIDGDSFEGYLFPDTYYFNENARPVDIIKRLVKEYRKNFTAAMRSELNEIGMTEKEIVILASIIEGEAMYDVERPIISGVYHNRLNKGMLLQADPTIQYILEDGPRRLLNKDLRIKSPYNTYLNSGLPPGPINNPGFESIKAALNPAVTDFIYFVAKGDGYHAFSKTQSEHISAKRKFQRIRREARRIKLKNK
ncbi:MAG: endolytic transglycosylase MltG [Candidatus Neomarinimicrobiota bacterium]